MAHKAIPTKTKYNGKTCKECPICGYISTNTIVDKHVVNCSTKQVEQKYYYFCSQCSFAFVFEGTFKRHCKTEPACENEKIIFMCRTCERTFNEKKVADVHIRHNSYFSKNAKDHSRKHIVKSLN